MKNSNSMVSGNNTNLFVFLSCLFVSCVLISNVLASKIISVFGISMTGGVILFPMSYILSDVLTEVYGYKKAQRVILYGFACNFAMVLSYFIAIKCPYPEYWENQEAFVAILGNTPRIFIASIVGYLLGGYSNAFVMDFIKNNSKIKLLGFRTIMSTVVGETLDTASFILIGFIGSMASKDLFKMILFQSVAKIAYEVVLTPVTCFVIGKIKNKDIS